MPVAGTPETADPPARTLTGSPDKTGSCDKTSGLLGGPRIEQSAAPARAAVVWRTPAGAATITNMSDALQTILADPELQNWPHRGPAGPLTGGAAEFATAPLPAPRLPEPETPVAPAPHPTLEFPAPLTTAVTAPTYRAAPAPQHDHVTDTADPTADDRDTGTAPYRDDPYYPPRDNTPATAPITADDHNDDDAHNSPHTPMSFDEITRRGNPFTDKFGAATQWAKNNWRNPRTALIAAAATIAVISIAAWATTGSTPTAQPTATITAPTTGTPSTPAAAAPADAPLPVKAAEARCPAPSTDPMNAFTAGGGQPWLCVQAWGIPGQVLTVTLNGLSQISVVAILPGANTEIAGVDQWGRYRTVERLTWTFADAARTTITQCTNNRRELVTLSLSEPDCAGRPGRGPVVASQVQVTIEKTAAPPSAPSGNALGVGPVSGDSGSGDSSVFAVSRLQLIGHPGG